MSARRSAPHRSAFALLVLLATGPVATPLLGQRTTAVVQDRHGETTAWLTSGEGLVVESAGTRTVLGAGADARFAANGDLWFARTLDREDEEVGRTWWILAAGAPYPVPAPPGAAVPPPSSTGVPGEGSAVKLCLDPGHGGSDPGALGSGLREADVTLDVVLRLARLLELDTLDTSGGGEWDVLLTRDTDRDVSLAQRTNLANAFGAASFLSVHMNSFSSSSANGTETYCWTGQSGSTSGALRNRCQAEALRAWGLVDRGVKEANFYVLRNTSMPATLVEGGFITSPIDSQRLADPNARQLLARGLLFALQEHHGYPRFDPGQGPATGRLRGVVYDAAQGTTARLPGALVSLADGRFAIADATGYFEMDLAPGTYLYQGTVGNYRPSFLSRGIVAGAETWGSLALQRATAAPVFQSAPAEVQAGQSFLLQVFGLDPGTPALALGALRPAIPAPPLGGLGDLWCDPLSLFSFPLGNASPTGFVVQAQFAPWAPGLDLHLQALGFVAGAPRLGNGCAIAFR